MLWSRDPVKRVCYLEDITAYMKDNSADLRLKFLSHVAHPGHTLSQDPPKNTQRGFTTTSGPMPKDIGGLARLLLIIQQALPLRSRESIKQEHYYRALGRYILGTTVLLIYKAVVRLIINSAEPVWSPIYTEAEMLKVREHSELLSAQYLNIAGNQKMYVTPSQQGHP